MKAVIVIDKPPGITSHDLVDIIRRKLGIRKVGHCGTLDPMATGVMVMLIGRATKLSTQFVSDEKEYICTMTLGKETDTQDSTGKVLAEADFSQITGSRISQAIADFQGPQQQMPPMISAKHYKGKRFYELARKGIKIKRKPQEIEIREIELLRINLPDVDFRVVCSKGTYVRTLCNDIGRRLGCLAHMSALRRTRSGRFHIAHSIPLDEVSLERILGDKEKS